MTKKDKNKTSDYVGFRAKTEKQKKEFYNRANTLKEKGISKANIFEAGLLALENGSSEEQLLRKKNVLINKRNKCLDEAIDSNKRIEAYNRQLQYKFSRHKDLNLADNVLNIEVLDNEGNKIEKFF